MPSMDEIRRRVRHDRGVKSPTEDSLTRRKTNYLVNHGYVYGNGRWHPSHGHHGAPLGPAPTTPVKSAIKRMRKGK